MMKTDPITRKVLMLAFDQAQVLDLAGPHEMFAATNLLWKRQKRNGPVPYRLVVQAEEEGPFGTTGGLQILADEGYEARHEDVDTLVVIGGDGTLDAMRNEELLQSIRDHGAIARRVVSVCSGSFLLAEAGLLSGKRATTHWNAFPYFRKLYPDIQLDDDSIFVRDGNVWTSAGVTSGMDLALALIAEDTGSDLALEVARKNVIFMMRPGGQSQFSTHLMAARDKDGPIGRAMSHVLANLDRPLLLPELSAAACLSERTFQRRFKAETGMSPAKYVELARLERARQALEATGDPVDVIAAEAGFGSAERMRRAFQRHLGVSPGHYRDRFRFHTEEETAP